MPSASTTTSDGPAEGLAVAALVKGYALGAGRVPVLTGITFTLAQGEMAAIMGPSGSGKTTLLNCIAAVDTPDSGAVRVAGEPVDYASEAARTLLRRGKLGIVFQFFNLIPTLTVRENVALPLLIARRKDRGSETRVDALIARVGLEARRDHAPHQLSGGEMKLVSVARALVHRPALLLADEPTGNVNPAVGRRIMATLRAVAKDEGATVLFVTHSPEHAAWADRVLFLNDGVIAGEHAQDGGAPDVTPLYRRLLELGI